MITGYGASGSLEANGLLKPGDKSLISSIARSAVAHNKVLEPSDVDFRVVAGGNVVVVESEPYDQTFRTSSSRHKKENGIVVPRKEAYDLIAAALNKKAQQLEPEYEQNYLKAKRWSRISLIAAFLTVTMTITTGIIFIYFIIFEIYNFTILVLIITNIFFAIILFLCLLKARLSTKRTNNHEDILLEIDKLYRIMQYVPTLKIKDEFKQLIEEIIIAEMLTLSR